TSNHDTIQYEVIPDSAHAGTDYNYNGGTNAIGTFDLPAGVADPSFTINTLSAGSSGDKLFTIKLLNVTSNGAGHPGVNVIPVTSSGRQLAVITDPNSFHTVTNNSFGENATVQVTGPRHNGAANPDPGISLFQAEADNATNDPTLRPPPNNTGTQFES